MTLFGTHFDGQQLLSLVSLLMVLVFWIMVWKRQRRSDQNLKEILRAKFPPAAAKPKSDEQAKPPTGPWG